MLLIRLFFVFFSQNSFLSCSFFAKKSWIIARFKNKHSDHRMNSSKCWAIKSAMKRYLAIIDSAIGRERARRSQKHHVADNRGRSLSSNTKQFHLRCVVYFFVPSHSRLHLVIGVCLTEFQGHWVFSNGGRIFFFLISSDVSDDKRLSSSVSLEKFFLISHLKL